MSAVSDSTPDRPVGLAPTGTVTFAFTDIEGSTQRWELSPVAMADALRRHDALVRASICAHGGHVFKTVGDAFCAAFDRAQDAVAAMLDVQRALACEDFSDVDGLRVRAAIHTGAADERDGDYFGPGLNRIARLLAIGHGGQVLVSGATTHLVRDVLPAHASLHDLGEHRLKDLARPENVYQLVAPGLAFAFAPLRSLDADRNNLPFQLTSFVGRESEVDDVRTLLAEHRLVTLVGTGGVGKTRTSLQVAATLIDACEDGVWFVELAPLANGDYVSEAIAQAMRFTLPAAGEPLANLVFALEKKRAVLVLDNCEHLIESAATIAREILTKCSHVRILATSRQALGIAGEAAYRMPSLGFPDGTDAETMSLSASAQFPAIRLFIARAVAADHRFALTAANARAVAEICRRLDGIALAIELAAARVTMLSPQQLCERLDERFRLLTAGTRGALPRQKTLRALIDWSYDLLDERERTLFRTLSSFVNGFTIDGATAVGCGAGIDETGAFDSVASLVDKSLVLAERTGDSIRYRLLESTRAYAYEKLVAAGERGASTVEHIRYLRDAFTEASKRRDATGRDAEVAILLATELDDVRVALDRTLDGSDVRTGGELLAAIEATWIHIGRAAEGAQRIEAFAARLDRGDSALLADLWGAFARLTYVSGRMARALEAAIEAVARARASGDAATLSRALDVYALSATLSRRFAEADAALAEAETLPEPSMLRRRLRLDTRARLSIVRGDLDAAARSYEELRDENHALGNVSAERLNTLCLAEIEHALGRTHRAIALAREVIPQLRTLQGGMTLAHSLANLAGYLLATDEIADAIATARDSISQLARSNESSVYVAKAIEHLALGLALSGDLTRAARLAGYADAEMIVHRCEREHNETTTYDRLDALLRERMQGDEREKLVAEGAALGAKAAIALARAAP